MHMKWSTDEANLSLQISIVLHTRVRHLILLPVLNYGTFI